MITQTAKLRVNDGKADEFMAAARQMLAAVQEKEPGTLVYDLYRSQGDPNVFMFFERYADDDALAAHRGTPHMSEFGGAIRAGGLTAGRAEIERFDPV